MSYVSQRLRKKAFIYKITNNINDKIYVGRFLRTWRALLKRYRLEMEQVGDRPIVNALRKYGYENFTFEIIEEFQDVFDIFINEREVYWIKTLNTLVRGGWGYNVYEKGSNYIEKSKKWSSERKKSFIEKITGRPRPDLSEKNRQRKGTTLDDSVKEKMRISHINTYKEKKNPLIGRPLSDEHKKKIKEGFKKRENKSNKKAKLIFENNFGEKLEMIGMKNLRNFCKVHSFCFSSVVKLIKGIILEYKGWKVKKEEI